MGEWYNALPIIIIILVAVQAFLSTLFKKEKRGIKIAIALVLILVCVLQIVATNINKGREAGRERRDMVQKIVLNQKIGFLNRGVDSLTSVIIYKQDGIRHFIEEYLLRDSVIKSKYDSMNKIVIENDRPLIAFLNPVIFQMGAFSTIKFKMQNTGKRALTNLIGKMFIIKSREYDATAFLLGSVSIPTSRSDIMAPGMWLVTLPPHNLALVKDDYIYGLYVFISGSYNDIVTKELYPYKTLFKLEPCDTIKDSIGIDLCRPWELEKVENFLKSKNIKF